MLDPGTGMVASAGIQAGSQLSSGIANLALMGSQQHYQRKMMRYQRDIQKELMAEQNAYNLGMMDKEYSQNVSLWNMSNAYNDPAAQRARLEAAGYNPYAMLGQGGAIGTSSSPAASAKGEPVGLPSVGIPGSPSMDMSFIGSAARDFFDAQMRYQQLQEQTSKTEMSQVQSQFAWLERFKSLQHLDQEISNMKKENLNTDLRNDELIALNALRDATWNDLINAPHLQNLQSQAQTAWYNQQAVESVQKVLSLQLNDRLQSALVKSKLNLDAAQIKDVIASVTLKMAQSVLAGKQGALFDAETGKVNAEAKHEYIKALGSIIGNGKAAVAFDYLEPMLKGQQFDAAANRWLLPYKIMMDQYNKTIDQMSGLGVLP